MNNNILQIILFFSILAPHIKINATTFTDNVTNPGSITQVYTYTCTSISSGGDAWGGTGALEYIWEYNDGGGWTVIPSETQNWITPPNVTVVTQYRRGARRSGCITYIYSNILTKNPVVHPTNPGSIEVTPTACNSITITSLSPATGGTGPITYLWIYSDDNGTTWNNIAGSNTVSYTPPSLVNNRRYQRCSFSGEGSCPNYAETNEVVTTNNYCFEIGNYVWIDTDYDGIQEGGEVGMNGVTVHLYEDFNNNGNPDAAAIQTTTTATNGNNGFYEFINILEHNTGNYIVEFILPADYIISPQEVVSGTEATDSDVDPNTGYVIVSGNGGNNYDIDAGLSFLEICGESWEDTNNDGLNGGSDLAVENVTIRLYNSGNTLIKTTMSKSDGSFEFAGIPTGNYYIEFDETTNTSGIIFVTPTHKDQVGIQLTDTGDSDIDLVTKRTNTFTHTAGVNDCNISGGFSRSALPVELLYFNGEANACNAQLEWKTISETNNDYFIIEHSLNGIDFTTLSLVDGNGTTSEEQLYKFTHENVRQNINHYRLKQVDFDGSFEYSEIIQVNLNCYKSENDNLNIYPNPTFDKIKIKLHSTSIQNVDIIITDAMGEIVKTTNSVQVNEGNNIIDFDLEDLNPGIYLIQLKGKDWNSTISKITKINQ